MRLDGLGGQVHICVQSIVTNQGGQGHTWEILILDLLLDAIWWNLGLFSHKLNLPVILIKAFIIMIYM